MEHFITLTLTLINNNFELKSYVIACKELEEVSATGENIFEEFKQIFSDFNIKNTSNMYFTTDRGKNIIKSIKLANEDEYCIKLIHCICHIYDNIITSSLKEFDLYKKIKIIVSLFKRSTKLSAILKNIQILNNKENPLKVTQDVMTRWSCKNYFNLI